MEILQTQSSLIKSEFDNQPEQLNGKNCEYFKMTELVETNEFGSDEFILPSIKLRSTSELKTVCNDSLNCSAKSICLENNSHSDQLRYEEQKEEQQIKETKSKKAKEREFYKSKAGYRSFESNLLYSSEQMEICRASKDSIKSQNVFTKLEELGSGSYAKVYKVLKKNDKNDKTEYALKVVNGDLLKRVNKVHEVHIEKRVLQKCSHENIIKIYQTFKSGNNYYFLLEYCSNGSLADFIQETHYNHSQNKTDNPNSNSNPSPPPTISLPLIKFYISSTLLALEHLHSQKILHRDLKPSNLLLTHSSLKLSDFNSSSLFGSPCSSFVGTPEYISPEMLCSQAQSALLDIWALGVVCYELFAGRTPFAAPTEHLIYSQIMQGEY